MIVATACVTEAAGTEAACLDSMLPHSSSQDLGFSLAGDEDQVAVGEPGANRVHLFRYETVAGWRHVLTIPRPEPAPATDVRGHGFGHTVALAGRHLVIGDYVELAENDPARRAGTDGWVRRSGVYLVDLESSPPRIRSVFTAAMPPRSVFGYAVAVSSSHVAASFRVLLPDRHWHGEIMVARVEAPDDSRPLPSPTTAASPHYAHGIALDGDRLLASVVADGVPGAWLSDLRTGEQRRIPAEADAPPDLFVSSVALAGSTAVLGGLRPGPFASASFALRLGSDTSSGIGAVRPGGPVAARHDMALFAPTLPPATHQDRTISVPPTLVVLRTNGTRQELRLRDEQGKDLAGTVQALALGRSQLILSRRAPEGSCRVLAVSVDPM